MSTLSPEHEVQSHLRVQKRLNSLKYADKYEVISEPTDLSIALNKLVSVPAIIFDLSHGYHNGDLRITIEGEAEPQKAGKLWEPDLPVLLARSAPSSFGRGDQTILDPTYRHGHEIVAADIGIHSPTMIGFLEEQLPVTLFVGQAVELKFYKMAIYEAGGHFDWHRDSTHSDAHHGTLLVALNTEWEGGDLLLRRGADADEMRVDLHPVKGSNSHCDLRAVAFFTDTEHKVEPVTAGVRVVLQYDIEVLEGQTDLNKAAGENGVVRLELVEEMLRRRALHRKELSGLVPDGANAIAQEVIAAVRALHASGERKIGFPLQYLCRRSSIRPEFLKGVDSLLYRALVDAGELAVGLHPVVFSEKIDEDSLKEMPLELHIFDGAENQENLRKEDDLPDPESEDSDSEMWYASPSEKTLGHFYLNWVPALQTISKQSYIEHTGNESQEGCYRYFGGGMFVQPNRKRKQPEAIVMLLYVDFITMSQSLPLSHHGF